MSELRNNNIVRNSLLLIVLISHIGLVFFYFSLIQPEVKIKTNPTENYYIISSNDISSWVNNTNNERTFQVHILLGLTLFGLISFFRRVAPLLKQISWLFSYFVKVFRLSPTYIIHRVLII